MQDGLNTEFTVPWTKLVLEIVFRICFWSPGRGPGVRRSAGTIVIWTIQFTLNTNIPFFVTTADQQYNGSVR